MIPVRFYQLARKPLEKLVPQLVAKSLEAGHRLLLRCADEAILAMLDELLWQPRTSFIPHGRASQIEPERIATQPVLLDTAWPPANNADCLLQIGGTLPDDLLTLGRVLYVFSEPDLPHARTAWRHLKSIPQTTPEYWRENDTGLFEKSP